MRQEIIDVLFSIRAQFEGTYTLRIIEDYFSLFFTLSPYLLVAIVLNVAVSRYVRTKKIQFSSGNEFISIISAAFIGIASPLPTYAAIPIGLSLMGTGVPFSAVMAFILASPLMNPTIFFLTATQISLEMAIVRTVSAFLLALFGGVLTKTVFTALYQPQKVPSSTKITQPRSLWKDIWGNTRYIFKYFSIAILLSSAVKALVPSELITQLLAGNAKISTLVAIGMGVPFYTCGGSAIPFMETLMDLGMNKGAMLAFFIAGPATKLETVYAYKSMLGTKVLVFYLVLTFIFSYTAGLLYSLV